MSAGDWLPLAQRVLSCEWADRRGRDGWCETHDDPWPCDRAQEAADVLAEELDQPTKEQKMGKATDDDEGGIVRCECGRAPAPLFEARVREVEEERDRNKRAAVTLGKIVERQCRDVLDATGMHHVISEDGDGDWALVWERLAEMGEFIRAIDEPPNEVRDRPERISRDLTTDDDWIDWTEEEP